jgi:hypothetical protein
VSAFLPADQGYALMKAAAAVMELHGECHQRKRRGSLAESRHLSQATATTVGLTTDSNELPAMREGDMLNQAVLADPSGTIFSVPERQLIPPRLFNEDGLTSGLVHRDSTFRDRTSSVSSPESSPSFFGEKNATRYSGLDLRKIVVAAYAEGTPKAGAFEGPTRSSSPSHLPHLFSVPDTRQSKELILDVLLKSITDDITSGDTFRVKQTSVDDEERPSSIRLFHNSPTDPKKPAVKVSIEDTPLGEEVDDTIDRQCWDESIFPVRGGGEGADNASETSQVSSSHHQEATTAAKHFTVVGADDFLPLFVYVLVMSSPTHLSGCPHSLPGRFERTYRS